MPNEETPTIDTPKEVFLGTPAPSVDQPFIGGSAEAEEEARLKLIKEKEEAEAQVAADQEALGGVAGASEKLAADGINVGAAGRAGAERALAAQKKQLQELFLRSMGVGVSPAEQAVNEAISQQQAGIESAAGATMGRGAITAARQGERAGEQLELRGQQQLEAAGLQDQIESQGNFGAALGSFRENAALLGEMGGALAAEGLGQAAKAASDVLGKDIMNLENLTQADVDVLIQRLDRDTIMELIFASRSGETGVFGAVHDLAAGFFAKFGFGDGGKGGNDFLSTSDLGFSGEGAGDILDSEFGAGGGISDDDLLGAI